MEVEMTFGERFKQTLEQREITQKQFALKMNVSESAISDYVNDRRHPNILLVRDFAKELGVSIDYLLDYHPDSKKVDLSSDEAAMIKALRTFPKEQQDSVKKLVEILSQK